MRQNDAQREVQIESVNRRVASVPDALSHFPAIVSSPPHEIAQSDLF